MLCAFTYEWWPDCETSVELELTLDIEQDWIGHLADIRFSPPIAPVGTLLDVEAITAAGPSPQPALTAFEEAFIGEYCRSPELRERVIDKALRPWKGEA